MPCSFSSAARTLPTGQCPGDMPAALLSPSGKIGEDSVRPGHRPIGEPPEALDCACRLYFSDPSAWSRTSAGDHVQVGCRIVHLDIVACHENGTTDHPFARN